MFAKCILCELQPLGPWHSVIADSSSGHTKLITLHGVGNYFNCILLNIYQSKGIS
jgi:hypothetical protein